METLVRLRPLVDPDALTVESALDNGPVMVGISQRLMGLEYVGEHVRTAAAGILRHADFGLGHAPSHFPSNECVGQDS